MHLAHTSKDGSVDVLDDHRCEIGEGPIWDTRTGEVGWVDIMGREVHLLNLATGARRVHKTPTAVGAVVPRTDHGAGWIIGLDEGPAILTNAGDVEQLATFRDADDGFAAPVAMRSNDGKCDPRGRLLLGTMAYDVQEKVASLYRLDPPDHRLNPLLRDVTISNGLAWTVDSQTMYFIDTPTHRIQAWDYDLSDGSISNPRPLAEIPSSSGAPDGMTIDADGCLWVAIWGGGAVHRYTPDGSLDRIVELPCAQVTSCAFVGDKLDALVITTAATTAWSESTEPEPLAGATFIFDPGTTGAPTFPYAG